MEISFLLMNMWCPYQIQIKLMMDWMNEDEGIQILAIDHLAWDLWFITDPNFKTTFTEMTTVVNSICKNTMLKIDAPKPDIYSLIVNRLIFDDFFI